MLKLFSENQISRFISDNHPWIDSVSTHLHIPSAAICAILHKELKEFDILDPVADLLVTAGIFRKKDSSTGPMQIFGRVGINAVNFAVEKGLTSYNAIGLPTSHQLNPDDSKDVRLVWKKLKSDRKANIEIGALNLICAANEVIGSTDFETFGPDELKRVFSRYNQNTHGITKYGEEAYRYYLQYKK